jgi:hypothetical protein
MRSPTSLWIYANSRLKSGIISSIPIINPINININSNPCKLLSNKSIFLSTNWTRRTFQSQPYSVIPTKLPKNTDEPEVDIKIRNSSKSSQGASSSELKPKLQISLSLSLANVPLAPKLLGLAGKPPTLNYSYVVKSHSNTTLIF